MAQNNQLRARLGLDLKRDVAILRQVVYKEIQAWKRSIYEANSAQIDDLNVDGKAWEYSRLSEGDRQFIDSEIRWFIFGEIPDDLVKQYAEKVLADLNSQTSLSAAQGKLRDDLSLGLKQELTKKGTENVDIPF